MMAARRRIGVMVPSTNTTCEADFQLVLPRSYTVHGQRLWLTNDALGEEGMLRMNGEIESGARYLATANVDAISYGCTTGSFFKGPGWDREIDRPHRAHGGRPRGGDEPVGRGGAALLRREADLGGDPLSRVEQRAPARVPGSAGLRGSEPGGGADRGEVRQPGHQRPGPVGGGGVRVTGVPARCRRAAVLLHGVAIGRSGRGDRAADRQARRQLESGEHLDDAAPPWPYRADLRLRSAPAEPDAGTGRGVRSTKARRNRSGLTEAVDDGQAPVAPERPRRDLHTDRALAALVLVGVHHADDTAHGLRIEAQGDDVGDALVLFDVGLQDRVEQR